MVDKFEEVKPESNIVPNTEYLEQVESDAKKVMALKGVGPATYQKLITQGFDSLETIASSNAKILALKCEITEATATKLIEEAKNLSAFGGFQDITQLITRKNASRTLPLGLDSLKPLFPEGIPAGSIVQFYGASGSGKTQLFFHFALLGILPRERGGMGTKVLYIDTENALGLGLNRFMKLAESRGITEEDLAQNLSYTRAFNFSQQVVALEKLRRNPNRREYGLILIDSFVSNIRVEFPGRGELVERQQLMSIHLKDLQNFSESNNSVILISNHVYSRPDQMFGDPTKAVGGNILEHACPYKILIRRGKKGARVMKVIDAPDIAEAEAEFHIEDL